MARRARYWRVRSAVTQQVNSIEAAKVNAHAAFLKMASGQRPFLGSVPGPGDECALQAVRDGALQHGHAGSGSADPQRRTACLRTDDGSRTAKVARGTAGDADVDV